MRTEDLDYVLPERLIAQSPAERREAARLMVARLRPDTVEHRTVADLPELLRAGDLLVLNDTRVLPARFHGERERTGGRVEGLFIEECGDRGWHVMLKSGGKLRPGEMIRLGEGERLELVERRGNGSWRATRHGKLDTAALLDRIGTMPLPPYIRRHRGAKEAAALEQFDRARYQTVYADRPGAVAAPTAGLHLSRPLLARLEAAGVRMARLTLHVGPGTFAPVRADRLEEYEMHAERFTVPAATLRALAEARAAGRRIIPIGTTCVRALESLPDPLPESDEGDHAAVTRLLIQPPYRFRFADGLMTNFHLPRSTLLALVAARTGLDRLMRLYRLAVEREYRFYSYGDAMLILPE